MDWVFWLSILFTVYTYLGYPLVLVMLAALRNRPVAQRDYTPKVSIIIPFYNAEKILRRKLGQAASL